MVSVCSLQISCRIVYVSEALLFVVAGIQEKIRAKLLHLILGSFDVNSLFEAVFADSFLTYKTLRVCYHHTTQYLNFLFMSTKASPSVVLLTFLDAAGCDAHIGLFLCNVKLPALSGTGTPL